MDDEDDYVGQETEAPFLTPEASAIASVAFAILSAGVGSVGGFVAQAVVGVTDPNDFRWQAAVGAGVLVAFAVLAVVLARRALASPEPTDPWIEHVARAAMVVAIVTGGLALVAIFGTLLQDTRTPDPFDP